ncbi:HELICc domain containing protein [Microcystis phage MJing1]|nr:HELICc domain containing protein [Microcystis phage MJing1]
MLTLRPFQQQEVPLLLAGHRALYWEPGVGKTLPAVVAGRESGMPQLWLTLADLRAQAAKVLTKERGDRPRVQTVMSRRVTIDPRADVVVCSYDLMREVEIWKQLFALAWGSIVCDEAHALANTSSVRTRAFYGAKRESRGALYRRSPNIWLLTGTPVMNNPMDMWPHISRLWPQFLPEPPTKQGWEDTYCVTRPGDYGVKVVGARNAETLRGILNQTGSFRALDLGDIRLDIDTLHVEISDAERREIEQQAGPEEWAQIEALFAEFDGGEAFAEMQLQARVLPLTSARRVLGLVKARPVARIAADELRGGLDRIIVWGHHVEALKRVAEVLRPFGCALLNGQTPKPEREAIIGRFIAGEIRAIAANSTVAGTGIDGLQVCRRAILLEPDWTPARNTQVIRRHYRTGQRRPVHVSIASAAGFTPDEAIALVLARKARIIKDTTGAEA